MRRSVVLVAMMAAMLASGTARGASPPNPPPITSPLPGQVVSPFDVHMEAGPFSDPDPASTHQCTDWEIWTLSPLERVWVTSCIGGVEKVHTHLADGVFENSHAGRTSLLYLTSYKLRVRFRDDTDLWSSYSELSFSTGGETQVFPLITNDVVSGATWRNELGSDLILASGAPAPSVRMEAGDGSLLLQFTGNDGLTNTVTNPPALPNDVPARVVVDGGSPGVSLPPSRIGFTDPIGVIHTIWLPTVTLGPAGQAIFWVSSEGSTYFGTPGQATPVFTSIARSSPVPWVVNRPGFEVEVVTSGLQLPVNIAFVPNPGPNPTDPYFYVTELYGTIKVVTRNGSTSNYATGLLNFNPTGNFPGSGEQGLAGIVVDPATGDLFAGMLYDAAPPDGPHYPKVVRFHSTDGGLTAATQTTVLAMPGELQGQSHFISNFSLGPDGKLYVHMGDGFDASTALNLSSFRGKVLRMNLDGSAPSDNPFYNASNGITSRDYIFAYGFRNPFGGAWRALDGKHYEVENGLGVNDRFARVDRGVSYGWDGNDATMLTNALYTWVETVAPVNIAFVQPETFGGSLFPASMQGHAFVTLSGPTYASGPSVKSIVEFTLGPTGTVLAGPDVFAFYNGTGKASAVGLASGPDGLYFTDLYKDQGAATPIDPGANVLRLRYRGFANFAASATNGPAPLSVSFSNLSDVPGATSWFWEFGDGTTSTAQNPNHVYGLNGTYDVRLTATGMNGVVVAEKSGHVVVGPTASGLVGLYYNGVDLADLQLSRVDPVVDLDWGTGPPAAGMPNDNFSVRWVGEVQPQFTQNYTFSTTTDDGVRLWINNQLLVDFWVPQAPMEHSGSISLQAGQWYPVRMEYFEAGGGAVASLSWQSTSQAKQIIPSSRLRTTNPNPVTGVDPSPPFVAKATLLPAVPNPVTNATRVGFALPRTGHATLRVYNVHGALVATLFDGVAEGQHVYEIPFRRDRLPGGVYFQRLEAAHTRLNRKLVLLP